jgi:hypothetical protein
MEDRMGHIFISYSRSDEGIVNQLISKLEMKEYRLWKDSRKIRGGEKWKNAIVKAIKECDIFIIILSRSSIRSSNVLKELDIADNANKIILPIAISQLKIPGEMEYQLTGLQRIDLTPNFEAGIAKVLEALVATKGQTKILPQPQGNKITFPKLDINDSISVNLDPVSKSIQRHGKKVKRKGGKKKR